MIVGHTKRLKSKVLRCTCKYKLQYIKNVNYACMHSTNKANQETMLGVFANTVNTRLMISVAEKIHVHIQKY